MKSFCGKAVFLLVCCAAIAGSPADGVGEVIVRGDLGRKLDPDTPVEN